MKLIHRKRKRNISLISSILGIYVTSFMCTSMVQAADLNVPVDFVNIQTAINAANSGDTIFVSPGIYAENINFTGKAITLQSTEGTDVTTIEPAGGTVVTMGPNGEISGFTIRNGFASFGAGMKVSGSGSRIIGNVFDSNTQSSGGFGAAIGGNGASPVIDKNIFRNNSCDNQGLSGVVTFVNASSPRLINNIFVDNPCRAINITIPTSGRPVIINNTIVRNRVGIHIDRRIQTSQQIYRNNILVDNEIGLEIVFGGEVNNPTWENNIVFNNITDYSQILDQTGLSGNISADPLFANSPVNDFRLLGGSPAIDTGSSAGAPTDDFEGDVRPVDGNGDNVAQFDIGADEFASGIAINILGGSLQECTIFGGSNISVDVTLFPPTATISSIQWSLDGIPVANNITTDIFVPLGDHLIDAEATVSGVIQKASAQITISDTLGPVISAAFIDKETGLPITIIQNNSKKSVITTIDVTDVCDATPTYNATIGIPAFDGNILKIKSSSNKVKLETNRLDLSVMGKDGSGNITDLKITLDIVN